MGPSVALVVGELCQLELACIETNLLVSPY